MNRRRPIPRKGHTKSRAGCIHCKRRKVKCDEVRPVCGSCPRLNLRCEYEVDLTIAPSLRTTPGAFDADDMNFFRHFLMESYPPLPIDGFAVWQQASQLSHQYGFLLHSMLALGASHLDLTTTAQYHRSALKHRVTAIKSLNQHLSKPSLSTTDAEAAFASLLALTFQSAYMPDGLVDFLTMVRGCFLVGVHSVGDLNKTIFKSFARENYVDKMKQLIQQDVQIRCLDVQTTKDFCDSVRAIGPLCRSIPEINYMAHMQKIANLALTDPVESYREESFLYDNLGTLSNQDFQKFIDPTNYASQLVILHMLILDFVMNPTAGLKNGSTPMDHRMGVVRIWIQQIIKGLPARYQQYTEWSIGFLTSLDLYQADQQLKLPLSIGEELHADRNVYWNVAYLSSTTSRESSVMSRIEDK